MTYRRWNWRRPLLPPDDKFKSVFDWLSVDLHLLRHSRTVHFHIPSVSYLHRGMKWTVNTLGDNVMMMKYLIRCMESSPSAGDTLVPYALVTPDSTTSWHRDVSRDHAYIWFLEERGYVSDLSHFYIEAHLRCIEARVPQAVQ
jgi:hypothetical protein